MKMNPSNPKYFNGERMEPRFLEESLEDMIDSRWERHLSGTEDAILQDLVDFNPIYLSRYNVEDLETLKSLIEIRKNGSRVMITECYSNKHTFYRM
jgi:hypothetical protein